MKAFFQQIFRKTPKDSTPASLPSRGFHSSFQGGGDAQTRAQLVQLVMRDLVKESGIPPTWIVCHPQVINSRSRGQGIFVRLAVKQWDERLIQHLFAFQKTLLTDIVSFDPGAHQWLHGIAWQLEVAATCPLTDLPYKEYWLDAGTPFKPAPRQNLVVPLATMPPSDIPGEEMPFVSEFVSIAPVKAVEPVAEVKQPTPQEEAFDDLERFFAVRDKELADHASGVMPLVDYQSTEPSPLIQSR